MISTLMIFSIALLVLVAALAYYRYRNKTPDVGANGNFINLPPTVKTNDLDTSVKLSCGNMQIVFRMLGTGLWLILIVLGAMLLSAFKDTAVSIPGKAVIDYLGGVHLLIYLPVVFVFILFYFMYSRKNLSWDNGLLIDGEPVVISSFSIRRMNKGINFIYLQSANRLWILAPATSQDNSKYQDQAIVKREQAFNETQMKQLQINLLNTGAVEKKMRLFPNYLTFGFIAFLVVIISVFLTFM